MLSSVTGQTGFLQKLAVQFANCLAALVLISAVASFALIASGCSEPVATALDGTQSKLDSSGESPSSSGELSRLDAENATFESDEIRRIALKLGWGATGGDIVEIEKKNELTADQHRIYDSAARIASRCGNSAVTYPDWRRQWILCDNKLDSPPDPTPVATTTPETSACKAPTSKSLALICSDPGLLKLETERLHELDAAELPAAAKSAVSIHARDRLEKRESCTDKSCMLKWYQNEHSLLQTALSRHSSSLVEQKSSAQSQDASDYWRAIAAVEQRARIRGLSMDEYLNGLNTSRVNLAAFMVSMERTGAPFDSTLDSMENFRAFLNGKPSPH